MKPMVSGLTAFGQPWAFKSPAVAAWAGAVVAGAAGGAAVGVAAGFGGAAVGLGGLEVHAASRPVAASPAPASRSRRRVIRVVILSIFRSSSQAGAIGATPA